ERGGQTETIPVPADILNVVAERSSSAFLTARTRLNSIAEVQEGSAASAAGLMAGDSILQVAGQPTPYFDQFQGLLQAQKNKEVELLVNRKGQELTLPIKVPADGILGVQIPHNLPVETAQYGLIESLPIGASLAWGNLIDNAKGLGKVATGELQASKALSGPVGIAKMFGSEVNWLRFWSLVGLLSMALALMNLLPIPGLDGGHTMFLLVEMIQGKPVSDKFMERAQLVGFVIIVGLMIFATSNDILRLFRN